ncbi:tripartite tricarboxylate transporter substrate-binding protein, partial [Bordetella bronchiseptica]|uniref:tripartite tricarboxylate transporter substrate-binding protein n=1 Tax=Bordetella bronchiseptica TaxID=518 RepID=UPI00351FC63C
MRGAAGARLGLGDAAVGAQPCLDRVPGRGGHVFLAGQQVAGINVVVENKPGAETIIGVQALMAAPPDGYTMLVTSSSSQS